MECDTDLSISNVSYFPRRFHGLKSHPEMKLYLGVMESIGGNGNFLRVKEK
jgi:hypothetical protein